MYCQYDMIIMMRYLVWYKLMNYDMNLVERFLWHDISVHIDVEGPDEKVILIL